MRQFIDAFESHGYLGGIGFAEISKLRQGIARLIGADPGEIAILKNTAEGLSTVAFGIDWERGDRVVTTGVEYPANIYPWMEAERRFGIELVLVPERDRPDGSRGIDPQELIEKAAQPRCRLVTVSHVQFASGQRLPLEHIGRWCRENGRLFCVDAIQSIGAIPFDVRAMHVDFAAAGSQKWMLGPAGAAFLYVRRELLERVRPLAIGAYSVVDPDNYGDYRYAFPPDMRRHESGTPPIASAIGWRASIDLLNEAGIDAIADQIHTLTDRLVEGLSRRGWRCVSPRDGEHWSGIVSFVHDDPDADLPAVAARLRKQHRIESVVREGRLRFSPHFYNSTEQMDRVVEAV